MTHAAEQGNEATVTATSPDAEQALAAWTAALTEAGWTPQPANEPNSSSGAAPARQGTPQLTDPTGRINARAGVNPYLAPALDVTVWSVARRPDTGPVWWVTGASLKAQAVIAAANAADESSIGLAASELLIEAGWRLERFEEFTASVSEHQWASADDTRWALFTTPEPGPDDGEDGGWILAGPGPDGREQRSHASACTPAATVAALAISG
jgi:hypothetical protein